MINVEINIEEECLDVSSSHNKVTIGKVHNINKVFIPASFLTLEEAEDLILVLQKSVEVMKDET